MNNLVLNVGQSSTGVIGAFEADGTPTPGAVLSGQIWNIADPSFTAVVNPDGSITITGVTPSTAPVSGTVQATVTEPSTASGSFAQGLTVQVNPAITPPVLLTKSIGVTFSTPA